MANYYFDVIFRYSRISGNGQRVEALRSFSFEPCRTRVVVGVKEEGLENGREVILEYLGDGSCKDIPSLFGLFPQFNPPHYLPTVDDLNAIGKSLVDWGRGVSNPESDNKFETEIRRILGKIESH